MGEKIRELSACAHPIETLLMDSDTLARWVFVLFARTFLQYRHIDELKATSIHQMTTKNIFPEDERPRALGAGKDYTLVKSFKQQSLAPQIANHF